MSGPRRVRTQGLITSILGGRLPTVGRKNGRPRWLLTLPFVLVVVALAPGAVVVVTALWAALRRRPDRALAWTAAAAGLAVAGVLVAAVASYAPSLGRLARGEADGGDLAVVAAWSLILGLPLGPVWWRLDQWWRERQPMGGPTEQARREEAEADRRRVTTHVVQGLAHDPGRPQVVRRVAQLRAVPDHAPAGVLLGQKLAGDLDWSTGPRGALVLPGPPKVRHLVLLGASGEGKSEVAWRKIEHAIRQPGRRQVIYLNCKQPGHGGSPALRLERLATDADRSVQVLRHGQSPWDPMRGTEHRIQQRLMAAQEWSEPWYQHLASLVLSLGLELARRRGQRPESLGDLVGELLQGGLDDLADDPRSAEVLRTIEKRDDGGLVTRLMDQAIQLAGWIGPAGEGGWSWEDADVIGADLPTSTDPGAARMLLRLMLTDLEGWITEDRRPRLDGPAGGKGLGGAVPLLLVIEEVSALDGDPILGTRIKNLMERARSSGVEVVVVAQDSTGLGDERTMRAVLTNTTVITGRQSVPDEVEQLAGLAGTRMVEEGSAAYQPGSDGGRGSLRAQHTYAVDPNMIRQLATGEVVVIHAGRWARVAATMSSAGYRDGVPALAAGSDDGRNRAITDGSDDDGGPEALPPSGTEA